MGHYERGGAALESNGETRCRGHEMGVCAAQFGSLFQCFMDHIEVEFQEDAVEASAGKLVSDAP
jgi:hypothetical protein